ncbi:MAG: hypothetical protein AABY00_01440 [Nanoarchaeota archaeon]
MGGLLWKPSNSTWDSVNTNSITIPPEKLDVFQRRMESICLAKRVILPYEEVKLDEGWMNIEWTSYKPVFNRKFRTKSKIGGMIYEALEAGERKFDFDKSGRRWTGQELLKGIREITLRLNPRMAEFISYFRGQALLLDRRAEEGYGNPSDWKIDTGNVTWFLKRPNY